MITKVHSQARKAIRTNKSSFWVATGKSFNDFNRNTGMFQTRKK